MKTLRISRINPAPLLLPPPPQHNCNNCKCWLIHFLWTFSRLMEMFAECASSIRFDEEEWHPLGETRSSSYVHRHSFRLPRPPNKSSYGVMLITLCTILAVILVMISGIRKMEEGWGSRVGCQCIIAEMASYPLIWLYQATIIFSFNYFKKFCSKCIAGWIFQPIREKSHFFIETCVGVSEWI